MYPGEAKGMIINMNYKVSVLMTVYNDAERFLSESIKSIINQSYKNIEFIIVNDGSIDASEEIIQGFMNEDKRIKFINRKINRGRVFSLNEGLSECNGKFLFINDADDISMPDRINKCVHFYDMNIKNKDRFGLLGTAFVMNDNNNGNKVEHQLKYGSFKKDKFPMWRLLIGMPFPHSSVMYDLESLLMIGGFPKEVSSSIDYFALLKIANKYDVYGIDDVLMERNIDRNNYFMTKEMTTRNEENMRHINLWCKKNMKFYIVKIIPRIIRENILKAKVKL